MFWADEITEQVRSRFAEKLKSKQPVIVRDEKTASGRVHVGSLRGVAVHGAISELLTSLGIANTYLFEINDFDPMDGLSEELKEKGFSKYLGMPLCNVPSPDGKAKNFAEYYGGEFAGVITESGYKPQFYRSSELYLAGRYNDAIRTALENADKIRAIYKDVSGSVRESDWNPVQVICEKCGKVSTTKVTGFDGETVTYECKDLEWTNGCGYSGKVSPFDGRASCPGR